MAALRDNNRRKKGPKTPFPGVHLYCNQPWNNTLLRRTTFNPETEFIGTRGSDFIPSAGNPRGAAQLKMAPL